VSAGDDVVKWVKVSRTPSGMTVTATHVHAFRRASARWTVKAYDGIPGAIKKGKAEAHAGAAKALAELLEEE
jgi:hypothetical protein